jgi:hypothetical protein
MRHTHIGERSPCDEGSSPYVPYEDTLNPDVKPLVDRLVAPGSGRLQSGIWAACQVAPPSAVR